MMLKKTIFSTLLFLIIGLVSAHAEGLRATALSVATTVTISVDQSSSDEDTPATFVYTFTRTSSDISEALIVLFDVSGSASLTDDYTVIGADSFSDTEGSVMIPAGQTTTTITITAVIDSDDEDDETIILTLVETYEVGITAMSSNISEGEDAVFTIELSSPNASGSSITVNYTVSGSAAAGVDYTAPSGSVEIAPNQETATLTIATLFDGENTESEETIQVSLASVSPTRTVAISTNNTTSTVNIAASTIFNFTLASVKSTYTEEIDSFLEFTFTLNQANDTGADIEIAYSTTGTAFAGFDYTPASRDTVAIPAGSTSVTLQLALVDDPYVEQIAPPFPYEDLTLTIPSLPANVLAQSATEVTINIDDSDASCAVTSTTVSQICFTEEHGRDVRNMVSNGLPDHATGTFPTMGNPNSIGAQSYEYEADLTPSVAASFTEIFEGAFGPDVDNYVFGLAINGITYEPAADEPWAELDAGGNPTGEENYDWILEFTSPLVNLGGDVNNAHPNVSDQYHYHGEPTNLVSSETGATHSALYGFAGDGFPIYYKYVYSDPMDPTSPIIEMTSSYQIISGTRPGDGMTAPDGTHDGTYVQDYEYVQGLGDLDEANGRYGVTPEYPNGTYYYVITGSFPYLPRKFRGTPSDNPVTGFRI